MYNIKNASLPFYTFFALHLFLLLLGQHDQSFLLFDAVLTSKVEGSDHDHDEQQEDGGPNSYKISEPVSSDPEHESDHDAEYASDC